MPPLSLASRLAALATAAVSALVPMVVLDAALLGMLVLAAAAYHCEAMLATAAPDITLAGTASTPTYLA